MRFIGHSRHNKMASRAPYIQQAYPASMGATSAYQSSMAQRMSKMVCYLEISIVCALLSPECWMVLYLFSTIPQSYAARPGGSGSRFSGGVYQGRATDLARKRVADAKTRMKQKQKRMGDKILSQRVSVCLCVFLIVSVCRFACVYVCGIHMGVCVCTPISCVVCVWTDT